MSEITFIGVGEAFDAQEANSSILIKENQNTLLLDCGYSTPQSLWQFNAEPNYLEGIYITHTHADHYFGLPALILRMWEDKRNKPLFIFSEISKIETIKNMLNMGYQGFLEKINFKINFIGLSTFNPYQFKDLQLEIAASKHSILNHAIKVSMGPTSIGYSGDGALTSATEKLFLNSDLLIHEAYLWEPQKIGHSSAQVLINKAETLNIKHLALIHLQREFRKNVKNIPIEQFTNHKLKISFPKKFDKIILKGV